MRFIPYATSMDVILVPSWLMAEIKRHQRHAVDLLDFSKISAIIPMNDLAEFLALQEFGEQVFGAKDIVSGVYSVQAEWASTAVDTVAKEKLATLEKLAQSDLYRSSVHSRIFSEDVPQQTNVAFELVAIGDKAIGVVPYEGFFKNSSKNQHHFQVTRELIKMLHVYEDSAVVAGWPITTSYLKQLQRLS
jgi:hypothetical protein